MPSDLERRLRQMYGPAKSQPQAGRAAAESDLLRRFETLHPEGARRAAWWHRWLLMGTMGTVVAVGACVTPVEYEIPVGNRIAISLDADIAGGLDPEAIGQYISENFPVERLEMHLGIERRVTEDEQGRAHEGAEMRLELTVLGPGVDVEEVWEDLQTAFPVLETGRIEDVPLAATVHGTLGGKLSGGAIDRVIDGEGVEEAKRRILADLEAQGIDPSQADVQVEDEVGSDGSHRREVRIRVEDDAESAR